MHEREIIFRGSRYQRGYGVGGFFAKLMRSALPLFKSGGKYLAKKAAKTGISTLSDIATGIKPTVALKRRIADVSDEMLDDVKQKIRRKMIGRGKIRAVKKNLVKKKKKQPSKKVKITDIFDY